MPAAARTVEINPQQTLRTRNDPEPELQTCLRQRCIQATLSLRLPSTHTVLYRPATIDIPEHPDACALSAHRLYRFNPSHKRVHRLPQWSSQPHP